jgi:hypothetical protein
MLFPERGEHKPLAEADMERGEKCESRKRKNLLAEKAGKRGGSK